MPPGAKKRKAAKKKQEQEASSTQQINLKSNNHDSRSQVEKESNDKDKDTIRTEKDTDERIEITDSSHDHDKSSGSNSSSSSSSSSSSDDESREVKKKDDSVSEVVAVTPVVPIAGDAPFMGSTANAIVENTGLIDSVTATPSDLNAEEQHIEISPVVVETTIENEAGEDKSLPIASDVKENEGKASSSSPLPESNIVPEVIRESEEVVISHNDDVVISHTEEEVTVLPTHGIAQRTSWFSCCGLFDVATGSK